MKNNIVQQVRVTYAPRAIPEGLPWDHTRSFNQADAKAIAEAFLRDEVVEVFGLMLFNAKGQMIGWVEMSRGTFHQVAADPREVVRHALLTNASSVALCHNHPGEMGRVDPSDADVVATARIMELCDKFNVSVLDHFVVGEDSTQSLMCYPDDEAAEQIQRVLQECRKKRLTEYKAAAGEMPEDGASLLDLLRIAYATASK